MPSSLNEPSTGRITLMIRTALCKRAANGGWYTPFEPTEINSNYTEGNSWQYSFLAPQDCWERLADRAWAVGRHLKRSWMNYLPQIQS